MSRLAAIMVLAALIGGPARAGEDELPFSTGSATVEGWVVGEVVQHEEFTRFFLKKGEAATCVEIRYKGRNDPDEWSSNLYRIQPCPGHEANEPLLRSLIGQVRKWEQAEDHRPFAWKIPQFFKDSNFFLLMNRSVQLLSGEGELPFSTGDTLVKGWVVGEIVRHEEFTRFFLKGGEADSCVEIRYKRKEDPEEWSSDLYRIQPCPEYVADEPFLRLLIEQLREWERGEDHKPFVWKIPRFTKGSQYYLVLNGLALLLFLVLLVVWLLRFHQDRIAILSAAGLAAGALAVLLCAWDPSRIPTWWITILHEGYGYQNVMHLAGKGVHAGDNFLTLQLLWSGERAGVEGGMVLRTTVFVNLCLAVVNTAAFFVAVYLATRRLLAGLLMSVLLAGNVCFLNALASETPAQMVLSYFFIFALAAACLNVREKIGRIASWIAVLQFLLVGFLICTTRQEMIVLVVPAVLAGLARFFSLDPYIRDFFKLWWGRAVRHWRWVLPATGVVAVISTPWWVDFFYTGDPRIGWAIDGLFPFNPSFLTLPWFLMAYLPLGLILLFLLGVVHTFRQPLKFLLLPLSLLVLWRTIYSATHGWGGPFYERFRFLTLLTPVCVFLAVFGLRELNGWLERVSWLKRRARLFAVLFGLTFLLWWPMGWGVYFDRGHELPGVSRSRVLLSRNQQTEVRYMLDLMDRYPDCLILTRTIKHDDYGKPQYLWGLFGKREQMDLFSQKKGETLEQVAAERAAGSHCVLFYYGLDCLKGTGDRCRTQIENRPVVEERRFDDLPYTDFHGGDSYPPIIRLGVYRVK